MCEQSLKDYITEQCALIDAALDRLLPAEDESPETIHKAMRYSMFAGGKRMRPVLCLAAAEACGGLAVNALIPACAVEMMHTYSLIHDDLPAMDNDDLRRGKPTNHRVFGEAVAILAGDGLLNLAYETMLSAPVADERPAAALRAAREIALRAGVRGMIAGQTLDVKLEGHAPTAESVGYIHLHKTADLLTAPLTAGLTLAGATGKQLEAGRMDCIAMSRQLIADADWPRKVMEGREREINRCIRCNKECLGGMMSHRGVHCIYERKYKK